jgi:ribosomal protein S18 acetylase RimI-like enzyme
MLPDLRYLDRGEWRLLRDARLTALRESPRAFLATHEEEGGAGQDRWLSEFDRGEWIVGQIGGETACQMGVTREFGRPAVRHLEYVWVAPAYRRSRVAFHMLSNVLGDLKQSNVQTVFLWVLDGNDAAKWLYKRLDFTDADERQEYPDPSRVWVRLRLDLA